MTASASEPIPAAREAAPRDGTIAFRHRPANAPPRPATAPADPEAAAPPSPADSAANPMAALTAELTRSFRKAA